MKYIKKSIHLHIPIDDLKNILWAIDDCLVRNCNKQEELKAIGDKLQESIKEYELHEKILQKMSQRV
jgi:hypothetical protein